MNNRVWIKVDLINNESYIGSVDMFYQDDESEDFMMFLEEQAFLGLKLDNVHRCFEKDGVLEVKPLDNQESFFKSSMIIMNMDNVLTIKFLKDNSSIVASLKPKEKKKRSRHIIAENVLDFKPTKKEFI